MSFIWDFTWVFVPSNTSSDSLWVVITKVSLFRYLLHKNAAKKVVTVNLMWWQQLFLRSFVLSPLPFKSIGHVLLSWASWKVPLTVGIQIWDMLAIFERIFLLRHSSTCFLPMGPYAGPLLFTSNLLECFIVLRQAYGSTYYFGPLPPHQQLWSLLRKILSIEYRLLTQYNIVDYSFKINNLQLDIYLLYVFLKKRKIVLVGH